MCRSAGRKSLNDPGWICYESIVKQLILPLVLCSIPALCLMGCDEQTAPSITLQQAAEQGNLKAVQQHIAARTDLNRTDSSGWTALHLAAMKGNLAIVQALTAAGADVKRKGPAGKTPLDVAREKNQRAVVQFLQQKETRGRGLIDGGTGVSDVLGQ
jgi:hypothetical protein